MEVPEDDHRVPGPLWDHGKRRFVYLLTRYYHDLAYDFGHHLPGVDFLRLIRERRCDLFLGYADRLPRNSYYQQSVSGDEEHARMLADALTGDSRGKGSYHPQMSTWSQESEMLAGVIDAIRANTTTLVKINSEKPKSVKNPDLYPRPISLLDTELRSAEKRRRHSKHESLARRMLPHKYKEEE